MAATAKKRPLSSNRGAPGSANVRSPAGKTPGEFTTPSPNKEIDSSKVNFVLTPNGQNLRMEYKNSPTPGGGEFLQIPQYNQSFECPSSHMSL